MLCSRMDLLNRALEQVIDQLVTQKISNLKLEIENQKQTILGMVLRIGPSPKTIHETINCRKNPKIPK